MKDWIDIQEKLPEDDQEIFLLDNICGAFWACHYLKERNCFKSAETGKIIDEKHFQLTHWLPNPPRPSSQ